jgi:PAS domain S-box-containing protein
MADRHDDLAQGRHGPSMDHPVLARASGAVLAGVVFWLDVLTPVGIAIPALYVLPILICVWARNSREPLIAAALATLLTTAGFYLSRTGGAAEAGLTNRVLSVIVIWTSAGMLSAYRRMKDQWAANAERSARAMSESLKGLDEIRYALDQAAIVAATDHRGIITYANDKFCEISKYSRDELIGQDHRIINSGYHPKEFIRDLWHTIAQGRIWRGEIRNRAKDGSLYWVDTTIVPFLDGRGKPRQYLAIRSDITQRKAAEAQIRQQAALTQLGGLAAVVAHEVRNPLAGLRATLQVLGGRFPSGAREREVTFEMIQRIDALNAKVEDLLLYARPRPPQLQAVDARAVAEKAAASAQAAAGPNCPALSVSGDSVVVHADPDMLHAAVLNLTMNACQAAGGGGVDIRIARTDGAGRIQVLDRGPGIAPELRERIFDPFFTTRPRGTGLGLAIVKRLVDLQSGTVTLEERDGGGTVAEVSLPLAQPELPGHQASGSDRA